MRSVSLGCRLPLDGTAKFMLDMAGVSGSCLSLTPIPLNPGPLQNSMYLLPKSCAPVSQNRRTSSLYRMDLTSPLTNHWMTSSNKRKAILSYGNFPSAINFIMDFILSECFGSTIDSDFMASGSKSSSSSYSAISWGDENTEVDGNVVSNTILLSFSWNDRRLCSVSISMPYPLRKSCLMSSTLLSNVIFL